MSIFKAKFWDNYDRGCDELAKLKIFNKEKKELSTCIFAIARPSNANQEASFKQR